MGVSPDQLRASVAVLAEEGAAIGHGFDVVISGVTHGAGRGDPAEYADAGATWWLEAISPSFGDIEELRRRIEAGPRIQSTD